MPPLPCKCNPVVVKKSGTSTEQRAQNLSSTSGKSMACCGSYTAFAPWSMSSLKSALPSVPVQRTPPLHFSIGSSPARLRVATMRNSGPGLLQSFVGLAPLNPLLSLSSLGTVHFLSHPSPGLFYSFMVPHLAYFSH